MNALLGRPRAIVTEKPGTTRDYLEEMTTLAGLPVRLVDTAGLREHSEDSIELEGMRRGKELAANARCVLVVLDGTRSASSGDPLAPYTAEEALIQELGEKRCIAVWNKADVTPPPSGLEDFHGARGHRPFRSARSVQHSSRSRLRPPCGHHGSEQHGRNAERHLLILLHRKIAFRTRPGPAPGLCVPIRAAKLSGGMTENTRYLSLKNTVSPVKYRNMRL